MCEPCRSVWHAPSAMLGSGPLWFADWTANEQKYAHDAGSRHAGGATADLLRWWRLVRRAVRGEALGMGAAWHRAVAVRGYAAECAD